MPYIFQGHLLGDDTAVSDRAWKAGTTSFYSVHIEKFGVFKGVLAVPTVFLAAVQVFRLHEAVPVFRWDRLAGLSDHAGAGLRPSIHASEELLTERRYRTTLSWGIELKKIPSGTPAALARGSVSNRYNVSVGHPSDLDIRFQATNRSFILCRPLPRVHVVLFFVEVIATSPLRHSKQVNPPSGFRFPPIVPPHWPRSFAEAASLVLAAREGQQPT